jgi:hypothetical protein
MKQNTIIQQGANAPQSSLPYFFTEAVAFNNMFDPILTDEGITSCQTDHRFACASRLHCWL